MNTKKACETHRLFLFTSRERWNIILMKSNRIKCSIKNINNWLGKYKVFEIMKKVSFIKIILESNLR